MHLLINVMDTLLMKFHFIVVVTNLTLQAAIKYSRHRRHLKDNGWARSNENLHFNKKIYFEKMK
jgi:hypothetical protein